MPVKKAAKKATKKVAKKATKKVAKKTTKRSKPTKQLVYASDETSFWVADGKILNSLQALQDALAEMEKEVFAHHVSNDKNDFSVWVSEVLCDEDCAKALEKAKTAKGAHTIIARHLKYYTN